MKLPSNKNITSLLTFASCLVIFSLGAPCLASYTSLPEESFSLSQNVQNVPSQGQKSLGEFVGVLGQRLAGVWHEVMGLVTDKAGISSPAQSSSPNVSVDVLLSGSQSLPNYFTDVASDPGVYFINLLAKEGIVIGQQGKFYPDNYLRLYDLIKMSVDLYRHKVGYTGTGEQGLLPDGAFSGDLRLPSRYVSTALHLGFLSHISGDYTKLSGVQRFVSSQDIAQMLVNIGYEFTGLVRYVPLENEDQIRRGEAAEYLVRAFDLSPDGFAPYQADQVVVQTPFSDIYGTPYQTAISTLAALGIVDTGSSKFYPDNYLHRYDFTIMFVNSLFSRDHKTLNASYFSGYTSPFADVDASSYAPFVYYAYDADLIDYLIVNKRGQDYFLPDTLMTKHEIYTILGRALGTTFVYDVTGADQNAMTRGEFSQILVDAFAFTLPEPVAPHTSAPGTGDESALSVLLKLKELLAKI